MYFLGFDLFLRLIDNKIKTININKALAFIKSNKKTNIFLFKNKNNKQINK